MSNVWLHIVSIKDVDAALELCTDMGSELTKSLKFNKVKGEPLSTSNGFALQNRAAEAVHGLMDLGKMLKTFISKPSICDK